VVDRATKFFLYSISSVRISTRGSSSSLSSGSSRRLVSSLSAVLSLHVVVVIVVVVVVLVLVLAVLVALRSPTDRSRGLRDGGRRRRLRRQL
jgi:uncharacterized protein HemY